MPQTSPKAISRHRACPACGYPLPAAEATSRDPSPCDRCEGHITQARGRGGLIRPERGLFAIDLAHGFVSLFRAAFDLVLRKEYVGKLGWPIFVNLIVLTLAGIGFYFGIWSFFEWLIDADWGWLEWLRAPTQWLALVASLLLAVVTLFLLAPILIEAVTGPFLDPLAQTTEVMHGGSAMRSVEQTLWGTARAGVRDIGLALGLQLLLLVPLLLLTLTGIGAPIAIAISAWLNAVIWFEIPCTRRGYSFGQRLQLIRHNWARAIGFGLAFQAGLLIPVFNILILTPAAAVATSLLYFHFEKPRAVDTVAATSGPLSRN